MSMLDLIIIGYVFMVQFYNCNNEAIEHFI